MRLRLEIPIDEAQLEILVRYAVSNGYQRAESYRAWTPAERKQAARYALERMVHHSMYPKEQ